MSKKIISAGHICIDITPIIEGKNCSQVADILKPGKLLQVGAADVHTGGSVANTGLAMKILGADVSLMGKVGNDEFGEMILRILGKYDAEGGMIVAAGENSSYSIVLAIPGLDRIFLHDPGANNTFVSRDVPDEALEEAALLHFGYPPLMAKMFENEGEELVSLLKKAHRHNTATSLDMASVDPNSDAGHTDWDAILRKSLPDVDFFVPSVEELCYMLDVEKYNEWQAKSADIGVDITEILDIQKDVYPLARKCIDYGAAVVLIKCGAKGMFFLTADEARIKMISGLLGDKYSEWIGREIFEGVYVPNKIVSGTGAGDTSIAAFLTAMTNGESPEDCLHLAAATGACCVEAVDALSGIKPFDELKARINNGWQKG